MLGCCASAARATPSPRREADGVDPQQLAAMLNEESRSVVANCRKAVDAG
jgi:hypothetical protein